MIFAFKEWRFVGPTTWWDERWWHWQTLRTHSHSFLMNRVKLWAFKTERHVCVSLLQRTHTHTHTLRNNLVNLSKTSSFNLGDCSFWITHCFQKAHSVPSLRKGLMMNRSWISNSYNRQRVCVYSIALGILKPYFIDNRFVCLCACAVDRSRPFLHFSRGFVCV